MSDYSLIKKDSDIIKMIIQDFIGPFYYSFVWWIINNAKSKGIENLYFVSRDGQILLKIAQKIKQQLNISTPYCCYLYGSRHAWYLPSLVPQGYGSIKKWLINGPFSRSPNDILKRTNLNPQDYIDLLSNYGFDLHYQLKPKDEKKFFLFLNERAIYEAIEKQAKLAYEETVAYFYQEGLFKNDSWALVDIGWSLRSQSCIKQIMQSVGYEKDIHGYYLGVVSGHVPQHEAGSFNAFISQTDGFYINKKPCSWMFKQATMIVLEDVFAIADHPSVISYYKKSGKIYPMFNSESSSNQENHLNLVKIIHNFMLEYVELMAEKFYTISSFENFACEAVDKAEYFFTNPNKKYVYSIASIPVNVEQTHNKNHTKYVAQGLKIKDIFQMITSELRSIPYVNKNAVWTEGSLAISNLHIRSIYFLLKNAKRLFIQN